MGIPAFFGWISQKYRRIVRRQFNSSGEVDNIFIDVNGLIHQACQGTDGEYLNDEEAMCKRIIVYIEKMLSLVRVQKMVYLAVDGVAPRAKLNQQRGRRFGSAKTRLQEEMQFDDMFDEDAASPEEMSQTERELREVQESLNLGIFAEEKQDHEPGAGLFGDEEDQEEFTKPSTDRPEPKWDSNAITPGTAFMEKVTEALGAWGAEQMQTASYCVIVSDSNTPGEGEHKFIDFIKREIDGYIRNQEGGAVKEKMWFNPNDSHAVVSLDADILLLSLSLHLPNTTVIREDRRSPALTKFEYVSIDALREYLTEEVFGRVDKQCAVLRREAGIAAPQTRREIRKQNRDASGPRKLINDLLEEVHDIVTDPYAASVTSSNNSKRIPLDAERVITDIILLLTLVGNDFVPHLPGAYVGQLVGDTLIDIYSRVLSEAVFNKREVGYLCKEDGSVDLKTLCAVLEKFAVVENAMFRSDAVFSHILKRNWGTESDEKWRGVYYSTIAGIMPDRCENSETDFKPAKWKTQSQRNAFIANMSRSFVEGIVWVGEYYSKPGTASWRWFYPFYHAPFAADIVAYLKENNFLEKSPLFTEFSTPLQPMQQLLAVLPKSSFGLLRPNFGAKFIERHHKKYPDQWVYDLTGCRADYHGFALLPFLNVDHLIDATSPETPLQNTDKDILFVPESGPHRGLNFYSHTVADRSYGLSISPKTESATKRYYCQRPAHCIHPPPAVVDKAEYLPWVQQAPRFGLHTDLKHIPPGIGYKLLERSYLGELICVVAAVLRWRGVKWRVCAVGVLLGCVAMVLRRALVRRRAVLDFARKCGITDRKSFKKHRGEARTLSALEYFRPKRCKADWICPNCQCKNWEKQTTCFNSACALPRPLTALVSFLPKSNHWSPTCYAANHISASSWR